MLVENGCDVLIADLALRPEAQVLADKHKSGPGRIVFQETNVIDWAQLERMFEVAEKEFGAIDIVCPGAGIYEPVRIPEEENLRDTDPSFNSVLDQLLAPPSFTTKQRFAWKWPIRSS